MPSRLVAAVAVAVLFAGCAALPGAAPDGGAERTVNPVLRGTPTARPTPTGGLPPG